MTTAVPTTDVPYPSNADAPALALCHDTIRFVRFHFRNGGHLKQQEEEEEEEEEQQQQQQEPPQQKKMKR